MKYIHTVIFSFLYLALFAQEHPAGVSVVDMNALHGKTKNSSSAVEWLDKEHFVYSPEEDGGKAYYLVSVRNWKPCRMFDNNTLAEKLKALAGLEVTPSDIYVRDIKFLDEKNALDDYFARIAKNQEFLCLRFFPYRQASL